MDINLSSQIVVQTAAQWAVDATVYSNKRILVTSDVYYGSTDQRKFKIADGVQTWSNLDYMPIEQVTTSTIGSAINGAASATPNDTDLVMSVDTSVAKKNTWTQIKAFLKTYFDTVYQVAGSYLTSGGALGTPSSGTLTNCTGLPIAGVTGYQGYTLNASLVTVLNALDATTYYFGFAGSTTNVNSRRIYVPKAGTIKSVYGVFVGTAGTNEQSTLSLRLNNTTDITITSTLDLSSLPLGISNTSLNTAVVAGDYFEFKWVTPTWATNPTGILINLQIYIE